MEPILVGLQHGACLCGGVVFGLCASREPGPNRAMGTCDCSLCRRWSGAAELPFVIVVPEHLTVDRGEELLAHYRDDEGRLRTFCRRCGSHLYYDTGRRYHVTAGVLDEAFNPDSRGGRL